MAAYPPTALYKKPPKKSPRRSRPPSRPPSAPPSAPSSAPPSPSLPPAAMPAPLETAGLAQPLDPAADSPPSPKSFRPLWRRQIRRVSRLQREPGHRVASSESLSLASMTACQRPPWDLALDSLSLSRRSSTDSSAPSRHRPESTRTLGKLLFHRRAKSKRNARSRSSSSATSSVYSVDPSADSGPRDFFLPALFSRRKPPRDDAVPKKLQISGPFNFQHVAHRRREDHFTGVRPTPWAAPLQDHSRWPARGLAAALPDPGVSSDAGEQPADADARRPLLLPRQMTAPGPGSPSRDRLQASPSPVRSTSPAVSPPPCCGRPSARMEPRDARPCRDAQRPRVDGGYLRLQPSRLLDLERELPPLPASPGHAPTTSEDEASIEGRGPLPMCETTLARTSGEGVRRRPSRRSRLSCASASSLPRGGQSMPAFPSTNEGRHRASVASETLGRLDMAAAPSAATAEAHDDGTDAAAIFRRSWEDDIDYCYEHEAEADCDYQWERPSLETARGVESPPVVSVALGGQVLAAVRSSLYACAPPPAPRQPLSALSLSPAPQASSVEVGHDAPAPASASPPPEAGCRAVAAADASQRPPSWRSSGASSLKEHFSLSPSLLIPNDFHEQLVLEKTLERDDFYGMGASHLGDGLASLLQRSSSSTVTDSTCGSNSTEKRHMSTMSSRTTLTQHTASSTSLHKLSGSWAGETDPGSAASPAESEFGVERLVPADVVPGLAPPAPDLELGKGGHRSHASEPLVLDEAAPPGELDDGLPLRRQRARTASLSTRVPRPAGPYALFPRICTST